MSRFLRLFILFSMLFFISCASSQISQIEGLQTKPITHEINVIAMSPSGGLLADAIGVELFNYGFNIIETAQTNQILGRLNMNEFEIALPKNISLLKDEGIDAYLSAKTAWGYDGLPQSSSIRINSTHTGSIIVGLSWQNGWGGEAGSIADRTMRKDLTEAASEISAELVKRLR